VGYADISPPLRSCRDTLNGDLSLSLLLNLCVWWAEHRRLEQSAIWSYSTMFKTPQIPQCRWETERNERLEGGLSRALWKTQLAGDISFPKHRSVSRNIEGQMPQRAKLGRYGWRRSKHPVRTIRVKERDKLCGAFLLVAQSESQRGRCLLVLLNGQRSYHHY